MRTVELDDDLYKYLLENAEVIGESASSIVRRLLELPLPRTITNGTNEVAPPTSDAALDPLAAFVSSDRFRYLDNATARYLAILSFIHEQAPDAFDRVLEIKGRQRKYFGRTVAEVADSGESTHPQLIPGSSYWAMTNADTQQKHAILEKVLRRLGYSRAAIAAAGRSLE